jgi:predicted RNA-binding Zn-ribbon protein involved in translation (DUF1610 family)
MNPCRNCGKVNAADSHFCRFCGTKLAGMNVIPPQPMPQRPAQNPSPYDLPQPQPYSWKTGEFTPAYEARKTDQFSQADTTATPLYSVPANLVHQPHQPMAQLFRCPNCTAEMMPRIERKISTTGWIVFAVLLVTVFPLFWIGLLIKEDVPFCQNCNAKLILGPYR